MTRTDSFQSILDNLLGNYVQQIQSGNSSQMPQLQVSWQVHKTSDRSPEKENRGTPEFADEPCYVLIRLYDNNGQPCLKPERLFEPFWSEHGKGRGIGLFQSRQLASQWGGAINIEAPENGPLVFKIELPAMCK